MVEGQSLFSLFWRIDYEKHLTVEQKAKWKKEVEKRYLNGGDRIYIFFSVEEILKWQVYMGMTETVRLLKEIVLQKEDETPGVMYHRRDPSADWFYGIKRQ